MSGRVLVKIIFSFLALGAAFLLAGCPAAIVATDERGLAVQANDEAISAQIKSDLMGQAGFGDALNINVYSFRGHVFIVGEADESVRAEAVKRAKAVKDVTGVTTKWFPVGSSNRGTDTPIEAKVDAELIATAGVPSNKISVDVWGGHVVLLGLVPEGGQSAKAAAAAKSVSGVKSVTNFIIVE